MNHYGLGSVGYGQISGASGGGQSLEELVKGLFGTLSTAGYMGTEAQGQNMEELGFGGLDYSDYGTFMSGLETQFGGDRDFAGDESKQGMSMLLDLLKKLDVPGMQQEYGQQMGDVGAEIGAQMGQLTSGMGRGAKGSRYGGLATPKRNLGQGTKASYLSDYYGLQEKQFEMQQGLQKQMEDDLYGEVGLFMQTRPYNPPDEE